MKEENMRIMKKKKMKILKKKEKMRVRKKSIQEVMMNINKIWTQMEVLKGKQFILKKMSNTIGQKMKLKVMIEAQQVMEQN